MLTLNPPQQGQGTWDGQITNYPNTQRRDVQIVQPNGYLVIQYDTDNPGVWPFHCHIAWHVSGGLYVNLMEQPAKIGDRGAVPQVSSRTRPTRLSFIITRFGWEKGDEVRLTCVCFPSADGRADLSRLVGLFGE